MPSCILDTWLAHKLSSSIENLPSAIKAEQEQRCKALLHYAMQHSTLYAQRFASFAVDSFTWQDFATLPFATAEDLQNPEQLLCVSKAQVARMVTLQSSGTTAPPKRLAFSHEDLAATKDFFAVGMSQLVQRNQRLLSLWPGAMRPHGVSALLHEALKNNGVEVFAGEAMSTEQSLLEEFHQYNPHVLVAAPRQLSILVDLLESKKLEKGPLHAVLSSAEYLAQDLEHRLQQQGLLLLDHYGISEAGYGGGVECLHKCGYHMRELDLYIEIIHPQTLQPLPHGHEGEIVLTTLTRKAMPLIRYRTGDVASLLAGPCPCGSPLHRLSRVQGRLHYTPHGYSVQHCAKGAFNERTAHLTL